MVITNQDDPLQPCDAIIRVLQASGCVSGSAFVSGVTTEKTCFSDRDS